MFQVSQSISKQWMLPILSAFALLTRLPVYRIPQYSSVSADTYRQASSRAPMFYWVPGLAIGFLLWILGQVSLSYFSAFSSSVILVAFWVLVTGGLHLDGVADSADAFVGGMGDAERAKQIMKDPTTGPMGVIALVMILLLKVGFVFELLARTSLLSSHGSLVLIILVPMLARLGLLPFMASTSYISNGGMAAAVAERQANKNTPLQSDHAWMSAAFAILAGLVVLLLSGLGLIAYTILILVVCATIYFLRSVALNWLSGYTGDVLGSCVELTEVALLMALLVLVTI